MHLDCVSQSNLHVSKNSYLHCMCPKDFNLFGLFGVFLEVLNQHIVKLYTHIAFGRCQGRLPYLGVFQRREQVPTEQAKIFCILCNPEKELTDVTVKRNQRVPSFKCCDMQKPQQNWYRNAYWCGFNRIELLQTNLANFKTE